MSAYDILQRARSLGLTFEISGDTLEVSGPDHSLELLAPDFRRCASDIAAILREHSEPEGTAVGALCSAERILAKPQSKLGAERGAHRLDLARVEHCVADNRQRAS